MTAVSSALQREFEYYLSHQDSMVEKYNGRVIVLKGGQVLGVYDTELDALTETQMAHALGTFLVQKVSAGDTEYSQTFHSRVVFS